MLRTITAIGFCLAAAPALADIDAMTTGMNLGKLLGSEEYCELTYDQQAISDWIDENTSAADMKFPSYMETGISAEGYTQSDRSASAKTAHCRATENTAKHYGFIAE